MTVEFAAWYVLVSALIGIVATLANAFFMSREDALCYGLIWFIFWPLFACLIIALLPLYLFVACVSALKLLVSLIERFY